MSEIRSEFGHDVDKFVDNAKGMLDWKTYVRERPLMAMAVVAAVGYLVVPKRLELITPDADTLETLAKRNKLVVKSNPKPVQNQGLVGKLVSFAATAAVRGAIAYAGQKVGSKAGK